MDIQITQIVFQLINFGLVVFVLTKFLYRPVLKILEQRSEKIEAGIKAAEDNLKNQAELEAKSQMQLKKARSEAQQILNQAKKDAQGEASKIIAKAKSDAKKVLETERKTLEASLEADRQQVHRSLAKLVAEATRQVLSDGLTTKDQHQLVESQIKTISKIKF